MPIFLKNIKRSLERDLGKVGFNKQGDYKYTPPNIVARKLNNYPDLPVTQPDGTPNFKKGAMTYTGLVQSQSSAEKYKCFLKMFGVPYFDKASDSASTEETMVVGGKVKKLYRGPISILNTPVAVRCSCKDFQHRFSHELAAEDALVGQPIKYVRKTPAWPVGRPYANSTSKVGICKHLWAFINELNRLGMIEE